MIQLASGARWIAAISAFALATGCAEGLMLSASGRTGTLDIAARLASVGTRVQTVVEPYSVSDVDHLVVKVFSLDGSSEKEVLGANQAPLALVIASASVFVPMRFRNLHLDTSYRVRGYAYRAPASGSAELISVDSSSYVDITLTNDDRPTIATLSVQLKARPFSGQATSSLDINPGGVTDVGGESISKGSPS